MNRIAALFVIVQFAALALVLLTSPYPVLAQTGATFEYISPLPDARFVSPATTIALRPGPPMDARSLKSASFNVLGSQSGVHSGSVLLGDDGTTVFFRPAHPFSLSENVKVTYAGGLVTAAGRDVGPVAFSFTITPRLVANPPDEILQAPPAPAPVARAPGSNAPPRAPQFVTLPSDYPVVTITTPANGTDTGDLFLAPGSATSEGYLIIMDDSGQPVFYKRMTARPIDFQMQPNGTLTYWLNGKFPVLDNTYTQVATYTAGNGYIADLHELQVLPNGHALLVSYDTQTMDLSGVGGDANAAVTGCIVQEVDTSNNVYFQWRSWDHFLITDTYQSLTTHAVDYVHCNAVEPDLDGNLLLSSRHMAEITKIDRSTGDIIWRLGGKNNQFTFVGDSPPYFTYQHDIRRLANGDITLFDNGNLRPPPQFSRGVEYHLDEIGKTATLVWQYRTTPDSYGAATGDTQRLPNGNTLIGWGFAGIATEVKPDNTKALELTTLPLLSYRVLKFPWHGYPTTQPTLVAHGPLGSTVLTYSWNGATDIASYRIYKGSAPGPTTLFATQAKTGFETSTPLTCDGIGTNYYRVMPIDVNDQATVYSNDVIVGSCLQFFFPQIGK
jgi:hypothetical protein